MPGLQGQAIGIGSLPHHHPEEAVELILTHFKQIPFWPQLPKRDIREGMLAQFSEQIPCLKLTSTGLVYDVKDKDRELEDFYSRIIEQDADYFKISPQYAAGLHAFIKKLETNAPDELFAVKCQITGPITFAASLVDEQGVALMHDSVMMQAIIKGLGMKALWQIKIFQRFSKRVIVFIDEPFLGCFGSAFTPINRPDVVKALDELTGMFKSEHVLVGVHCCGNTDWSIFTDVKGIDIINFDAYGFLDKLVLYAPQLQGFLEKGGMLCWGIVPTGELSNKDSVAALHKKITEGLNLLVRKGISRKLLTENLLVSPSCGLGTLTPRASEQIFSLLTQLSLLLR